MWIELLSSEARPARPLAIILGLASWGRGGATVARLGGAPIGVKSGVRSSSSGGVDLSTLSGNVVIDGVQVFGGRAVKVEPPVADEVVLVEDGAIGAEEGVQGETAQSVLSADVENLA